MGSDLDDFGKEADERKRTRRNRENEAKKEACESTQNPLAPSDGPQKEADKLKKTQWAVVGSGSYMACATTVKALYPGVYTIQESQTGFVYCENPLNIDDLIDFPDSVFDKVIKEVDSFWQIGDTFHKYGFLHRRGYLFYGPAGSGKSCLTQRLIKNVLDEGGIVFICEGRTWTFSEGLKQFREVEPNRKVICVFEDIDAIIEKCSESDLLSLLDGENQVNKVINIATTNYPERLDKRIVARPRRFDRIVKISMPNEEIRKIYFQKKLKINGEDSKKWVEASDGLSFAALAELVISVKCLCNPFDEAVEKLKEMSNTKVSSGDFETKPGFLQK